MKSNKKAAVPIRVRAAAKNNINAVKFSDSSLSAQRARLLDALSRKSMTSLEIRHGLDILHPAGRVIELRRRGIEILLTWVYQPTDGGRFHRVGLYTVVSNRRGSRHASKQ